MLIRQKGPLFAIVFGEILFISLRLLEKFSSGHLLWRVPTTAVITIKKPSKFGWLFNAIAFAIIFFP